MRDDLNQLTSIARDLQEAKQSLEPEDLSNFNKTLSKLRNDISKKQRGFRFLVGAACIALLGIAIPSTIYILEKNKKESELSLLVKSVENIAGVNELDAFIQTFQKTHLERKDDPLFRIHIEKAKMLIESARKKDEEFSSQLIALNKELTNSRTFEQLRNLQDQKSVLRENLSLLNVAFKKSQASELLKIDLRWNEKRDFLQKEIAQELFSSVEELHVFGSSALELSLEPKILDENLAKLNGKLLVLEAEVDKYRGIEGIGLSVGQIDVINAQRELYLSRKKLMSEYYTILSNIKDAKSIDEIFTSYNNLVEKGLVGSAVHKSVQNILLLKNEFSDLIGKVFFPDDPASWRIFSAKISSDYKVNTILDSEMVPLQKLYSDKRIQKVVSNHRYRLESPVTFEPEPDGDFWNIKDQRSDLRETIWTVGDLVDHKLEFKPGRGSGSYKMTQTANVIVGDKAEKRDFESQWTGVSKALKKIENIVRVKGDVIVGGELNKKFTELSAETKFLYHETSPMVKLFSPPRVNSPPLKFLDQLKEENLDPFIKSLVFS